MALGFGRKKNVVADAPPLTDANNSLTEKPAAYADGYGAQGAEYDPEQQAGYGSQRRMSRIDKAVTKPIAGNELSDDSSGISVGKQMELESSNAIKYRTCSWQKVRF